MHYSWFMKHRAYRDVFFQVLKKFDTGTKFKLKIEWWNLGTKEAFSMGLVQSTTIDKADLASWESKPDLEQGSFELASAAGTHRVVSHKSRKRCASRHASKLPKLSLSDSTFPDHNHLFSRRHASMAESSWLTEA